MPVKAATSKPAHTGALELGSLAGRIGPVVLLLAGGGALILYRRRDRTPDVEAGTQVSGD